MLNTHTAFTTDSLWRKLLNLIRQFAASHRTSPHSGPDLVLLNRPAYAQVAQIDIGRRFPVDPARAHQLYRAADEYIA